MRASFWLLAGLAGVGAIYLLARAQRDRLPPEFGSAVDTVDDSIGAVVSKAVDLLTPRGIRNNNPGNIEWIENPKQRWRGMIGADGRYGIFDTPANGVRAIGGELKASFRKGQNTVRAIINEWAPPTENNTSAYVGAVSSALRVGTDEPLGVDAIPQLAAAIIKHENGRQPYALTDIAAWVNS